MLILLWRHLLEKFLELICFRSSKAQEILLDYAGIDPGSSWFWVRRLHHSAIMLFLKISDLKYLYLQVISSNSDFKRIWTNWTFVYDYLIIYSWSLYYWVCYKTYFLLICQIYYLFTYSIWGGSCHLLGWRATPRHGPTAAAPNDAAVPFTSLQWYMWRIFMFLWTFWTRILSIKLLTN